MRFRYKVEHSWDPWTLRITDYKFKIQMYYPDKVKKWKNFDDTYLQNILDNVYGHRYSLETCLKTMKENGGIENIMTEYIKNKIKENEMKNIEIGTYNQIIIELDEMLVSKKWKVISVEE